MQQTLRTISAFLRFMRKAVWGSATAGALALLATASPVQSQSAGDYQIGPQDVLTIQVFDQADLGGKYTVETDGTFSFPLVGRVKAGGMTLRAFEVELKAKLADGYFRNPQVTVAVEQYRSQRVFVMGEVRAPGPVALTGGMTLIEALSRAGSTQPTASGEVAVVRAAHGAKGPLMPNAEIGHRGVPRVDSRAGERLALAEHRASRRRHDLRSARGNRLCVRPGEEPGRICPSEGHHRAAGAVARRRGHRERRDEPRADCSHRRGRQEGTSRST